MFEEKKFVITGASSGIGLAICKMLLASGAVVIGMGRQISQLQLGERFHPFEIDFEQTNQLEKKFKALIKTQPAINGLICAAGYGRFAALEQFSFSQMQSLMNVNFMANALLTRLLLPVLKENKAGDIVFIGSEASLQGGKNGAMYCASKFAVRGFAQALREECAKSNVRISLINPGMVQTPFFDSLHFKPGECEENFVVVEDIANAVKLILSARQGTVFDEINVNPLKRVIKFD